MGAAFWLASALSIFLVARIIPPGRHRIYLLELATALGAALACGLAATALDFGGWKELDWRAMLFVALGTAAFVGAERLVLFARN